MDNRVSYMLNNMIAAVDEGFSYDGIVSVPDTCMEDVEYRSGLLAGSLRDGVVSFSVKLTCWRLIELALQDRVRITSATISQGAAR